MHTTRYDAAALCICLGLSPKELEHAITAGLPHVREAGRYTLDLGDARRWLAANVPSLAGRKPIKNTPPSSSSAPRTPTKARATAPAPKPATATSKSPPARRAPVIESTDPLVLAAAAEMRDFHRRHGRMPTQREALEITEAERKNPGAAARTRAASAEAMGLPPAATVASKMVGARMTFPVGVRR